MRLIKSLIPFFLVTLFVGILGSQSQGYYVVLVEGTPTEINTAESILSNQGVRDWEIHNAPTTGNVRNRTAL